VSFNRIPVTQRLRELLGANRDSSLEDCEFTFRDLARVLERRKSDPDFWAPLTKILEELVESAVHGKSPAWQRFPQLKLLATWNLEHLSERLREALPRLNDPRGTKWEERSNPAMDTRGAIASALLLLGLAAGCSNNDSSQTGIATDAGSVATGGSTSIQFGATGGATSCAYPPTDAGRIAAIPRDCSSESAGALFDTMDGACLSTPEKQALFAEFSNLKASWCNGLVELFKNETPQVIAAQLETLLTCDGHLDSEFTAEARQRLIDGMLCTVILYKGVSFPESEKGTSPGDVLVRPV
jgi:hypothetical protein